MKTNGPSPNKETSAVLCEENTSVCSSTCDARNKSAWKRCGEKKRSVFHCQAVDSDGWKVSSLALWTSRAQQPHDGSVCPTHPLHYGLLATRGVVESNV